MNPRYAKAPAFTANNDITFIGNTRFHISGDRVVITLDGIANLRKFDNVSGTLTIELWALEQPYDGAAFHGIPLAGTRIGEILGQRQIADCNYDLIFAEPPAGSWQIVLMLREWDGDAYVTRAFINYPALYQVDAKRAVVRGRNDNIIDVDFTNNSPETLAEQADTPASSVSMDRAEQHETTVGAPNESATIEDAPRTKGIGTRLLAILRKRLGL